jgi:hypothetical protein
VGPPKEREAEYREVLADFERRKGAERRLERKFEIAKPYILLKAEEADQFQSGGCLAGARRIRLRIRDLTV